ncbi:MAG: endopeptidase [Terriglobia bacterium]|nr:MAG: endopeptidase [Terriglobia bacterium]
MRARVAAAFVLGCAVGAVGLGVALWRIDALRTSVFRAQEQPLPEAPGPLDTALAAGQQQSQRPLEPPPSQLPQELPGVGEAERTAPENNPPPSPAPLHLQVPIAGLSAESLHDTFSETRDGHAHEALDIPAPRGTPVVAAGEGNVVKLFTSKQGGLTVYQFDNSQTYCYYYAHLERYAHGLREGVLLRAGDVLGYVGTTGDAPATSPHLHFAVYRLGPEKQWWKGTAVDPLPLLRGK